MILLVDIGNTRIKWAWLQAGGICRADAIVHGQKRIDILLMKALQELPKPTGICLASVGSKALRLQFIEATKYLWPNIILQEIHTVKNAHGISNLYSEPEKLGVDRWLAMLAAYHHYSAAVCVVDCGTAITLDAVDQHGTHLGGLIMPGFGLMKQVLSQGTADLNISSEEYNQGLANNTEAAIFNGNLYAIKGFIESGLAQFRQTVQLILTGGDANFIMKKLKLEAIVDKDLVFKGLALVVDKQA